MCDVEALLCWDHVFIMSFRRPVMSRSAFNLVA